MNTGARIDRGKTRPRESGFTTVVESAAFAHEGETKVEEWIWKNSEGSKRWKQFL